LASCHPSLKRRCARNPGGFTLAATIDTWWPEINAFVATGITNARTEGYNRLVK